MKRRQFLVVGAAFAGAGAAGLGWHAVRRGVFRSEDDPAYEAWRAWPPRPEEGPMALVRAAVLAASPHNTQPWLFRVSPAQVDLFADRERNIGTIDPLLREMSIGLGCALENLVLAAGALGHRASLTLLPQGPAATQVASLRLDEGGAEPSPLFAAIPLRHTTAGRMTSRARSPARPCRRWPPWGRIFRTCR